MVNTLKQSGKGEWKGVGNHQFRKIKTCQQFRKCQQLAGKFEEFGYKYVDCAVKSVQEFKMGSTCCSSKSHLTWSWGFEITICMCGQFFAGKIFGTKYSWETSYW